jgi:hypothetical protein
MRNRKHNCFTLALTGVLLTSLATPAFAELDQYQVNQTVGNLKQDAYREMLKTALTSQNIARALSFKYLASSRWAEKNGANHEKIKKEANEIYKRLLAKTPSLTAVSEGLVFEEQSVCSKLVKLKSTERTSSASSQSSVSKTSSRSAVSSSVAAKFGLNAVIDMVGSISGSGSYSDSFQSSESSSSYDRQESSERFDYYRLDESLQCGAYKVLERAVVHITPDLMKLDDQLLAEILVTSKGMQETALKRALQSSLNTFQSLKDTQAIMASTAGVDAKRLNEILVKFYGTNIVSGPNATVAQASDLIQTLGVDMQKRLLEIRQSAAFYQQLFAEGVDADVVELYNELFGLVVSLEQNQMYFMFMPANKIPLFQDITMRRILRGLVIDEAFKVEPIRFTYQDYRSLITGGTIERLSNYNTSRVTADSGKYQVILRSPAMYSLLKEQAALDGNLIESSNYGDSIEKIEAADNIFILGYYYAGAYRYYQAIRK